MRHVLNGSIQVHLICFNRLIFQIQTNLSSSSRRRNPSATKTATHFCTDQFKKPMTSPQLSARYLENTPEFGICFLSHSTLGDPRGRFLSFAPPPFFPVCAAHLSYSRHTHSSHPRRTSFMIPPFWVRITFLDCIRIRVGIVTN
jgi:hypothetical protein